MQPLNKPISRFSLVSEVESKSIFYMRLKCFLTAHYRVSEVHPGSVFVHTALNQGCIAGVDKQGPTGDTEDAQ